MLYELIGIVRPGNVQEVKEIVTAAGNVVLRQGGVIRSIANWGVFSLPRSISKNQQHYYTGHYFAMRYDAGVNTQVAVRNTLMLEPRVIRSAFVKLGDGKLETLSKFGQIVWNEMEM